MHKGEQVSFSWCCFELLVKVTFTDETPCSLSAQGIQESTTMIIDNMMFVNFKSVKIGILFLLQIIIYNDY